MEKYVCTWRNTGIDGVHGTTLVRDEREHRFPPVTDGAAHMYWFARGMICSLFLLSYSLNLI